MFSFLNPIFLWGAAAAVVPLILHLMQRRRIIRMPFSTIRFLKMAERRSAQRMRMENLLLWLLRTTLILSLVLAFAMPVIQTTAFRALLSRAHRDIAIVLDGSYSMSYSARQGTVWDKSIEAALEIVEGLQDGDRVCIYVARDFVDPVLERPTVDRDLAAAQLRAIEPQPTSSRLMPALGAAYSALLQEGVRREREIHVITDGQAYPWQDFSPTESTPTGRAVWPPEAMDPRTGIFVTLTGAATPNNSWVKTMRVQPSLILSGTPCRVEVDLGTTGTAREPVVSLYLDDAPLGERAAGTASGRATFALPRLAPGLHVARTEIASDNLLVDDVFYSLVRVRDQLRVLCVGNERDTFFVSRALAPRGAASMVAVEHAGDRELLERPLRDYLAIFLCGALPLPGQVIARLEDYVKQGGQLVVFPGDRGHPGDYAAWESLGAIAPSATEELPAALQKQTIRWKHPPPRLLEPILPDPGSAPVIAVQRHLAWTDVDAHADVLLVSGAESPFLVSQLFGRGRVFVFAVSADRTWSSLPLSPFFLPLVHRFVQLGAGVAASQPFAWGHRHFPITDHVPDTRPAESFVGPDGAVLHVAGNGSGDRALHIENLILPGVYARQAETGRGTPALAVNMRRDESDLTPIAAESIPELIGTDNVTVSRGWQGLKRGLSDHRQGRTLAEQFLWLALAAAIAEAIYANWKAKRLLGTPGRLRVNLAGKLVKRT